MPEGETFQGSDPTPPPPGGRGLMSVLPQPSAQHIKQIENIMFKFIWGNTEKIKRTPRKNVKNDGGLQVPDVASQANSLKVNWVKIFLDP